MWIIWLNRESVSCKMTIVLRISVTTTFLRAFVLSFPSDEKKKTLPLFCVLVVNASSSRPSAFAKRSISFFFVYHLRCLNSRCEIVERPNQNWFVSSDLFFFFRSITYPKAMRQKFREISKKKKRKSEIYFGSSKRRTFASSKNHGGEQKDARTLYTFSMSFPFIIVQKVRR